MIWSKVEKLRRTVGAIGLPDAEINRFGRRSDFRLLEAIDAKTFVHSCNEIIEAGNILSKPVKALLREAQANGVHVIVVEMPMHPTHVREFYSQLAWKMLRGKIQAAVVTSGGTYLNASEWVPDSKLFVDNLHLSTPGAVKFSELLGAHLVPLVN